jgi:hypothetical protein
MCIGQNRDACRRALGGISLTSGRDRNPGRAWKRIWGKIVSSAIDLADRQVAPRYTVHCPGNWRTGAAANCGRELLRLEYLYLRYGRRN